MNNSKTPKSKCPICLHYGNVEGRRRLTAYEDDRKNHLLSCYKCFKRDCDAMEEMWSEYRINSVDMILEVD